MKWALFLLLLPGCYKHIELGGGLKLGGLVVYVVDVEIRAALVLSDREKEKDENEKQTGDLGHTHAWECL